MPDHMPQSAGSRGAWLHRIPHRTQRTDRVCGRELAGHESERAAERRRQSERARAFVRNVDGRAPPWLCCAPGVGAAAAIRRSTFAGRPAAARPAAWNALGRQELHAREMRMCRARGPSCAMSTDALPGALLRTSCGRRGGAHSRRSTFAGRPARKSWDATRLHAREMRMSSWYGRALRPPARGRWPLATVTAGSHGWPGEPPGGGD